VFDYLLRNMVLFANEFPLMERFSYFFGSSSIPLIFSSQAKPSQAKPSQAKPSQAKPSLNPTYRNETKSVLGS
jgi:hypothetical protein